MLASTTQDERLAFWAPEVLRVEGELLWRGAPPAPAEAEPRFQAALKLARRRGEKSLELRAATSLARLWQEQGRRNDARRLLAGVYGWFTEGFDTADLRAAQQTLRDLD